MAIAPDTIQAPGTTERATADRPGRVDRGPSAAPAPLADWLRELLEAVKHGLSALYASRLCGVYVFGSYARGLASGESDVDVAIVLDEVRDYAGEIERTSELIGSMALAHDVSISRVFISRADWDRAEDPFLHQVRSHAIAA